MTKPEFDSKVKNFCHLVKWRMGHAAVGENYLKEEIFKFYAYHRQIPVLSFDETNYALVMELPTEERTQANG